MMPMRGILRPVAWARAANGHAAAPPTNEMKLRRLMCPQVGANVPRHQEADTALCSAAKLAGVGPVRVKLRHGGSCIPRPVFPPIADIRQRVRHVADVPIATKCAALFDDLGG